MKKFVKSIISSKSGFIDNAFLFLVFGISALALPTVTKNLSTQITTATHQTVQNNKIASDEPGIIPGMGGQTVESVCAGKGTLDTSYVGYSTAHAGYMGPRCSPKGTPSEDGKFDSEKAKSRFFCGKEYSNAWKCTEGIGYSVFPDSGMCSSAPDKWCPAETTGGGNNGGSGGNNSGNNSGIGNNGGSGNNGTNGGNGNNSSNSGNAKGVGESCNTSGTICDITNNSTACYPAIDGTSLHCCRFTERFCVKTGKCEAGGTAGFQDCGKPVYTPTPTPDGYFNAQACSGAPGSPTNHCNTKNAANQIVPCCPGYREQRGTDYCSCVPNATSSTNASQTIASASECSRNSDCKKVNKSVCVLNNQNIGTCE